MLTLDTSALYAIFKPEDAHHERVLAARDADTGPYFVPAGILGEIGWMAGATLALSTLVALLQDLDRGAYSLDCGERNFRRMQALVTRYDDLPLGLADASVVACAERHHGLVLTTDRRYFDVVSRGEGTISVLPE